MKIIKRIYQYFKFRSHLLKMAEAEILLDSVSGQKTDTTLSESQVFKESHRRALKSMPLYKAQLEALQANLRSIDKISSDFREELTEGDANSILDSILGFKQEPKSEHLTKLRVKYQLFDWFGWAGATTILRTSAIGLGFAMVLVAFFLSLVNTQNTLEQSNFSLLSYETTGIVKASRANVSSVSPGIIENLFSDNITRSYTFETQKSNQTFELKSPIKTKGAQFLTLMPQAKVKVSYHNGSFDITLISGDVYYFGHKGVPTTFHKKQFKVQLLGTRVYFADQGAGLKVYVTEGKVKLLLNNQASELTAGQSVATTFASDAGAIKVKSISFKELRQVEAQHQSAIDTIVASMQATKTAASARTAAFTSLKAVEKTTIKKQKKAITKTPGKAKPKAAAEKITGSKINARLTKLYDSQKNNSSKPRVKIFINSGSQITGEIVSMKNGELVLATVFGQYRTRVANIVEFNRVD